MCRMRYHPIRYVFMFVFVPLLLFSLLALFGGPVGAQNGPTQEPTLTPDPPTETPPDIPTAVIEPPTATPEPPTEIPPEVPTEEIPPDIPTQQVIITPTETGVPEAPVFMVPEPLAVDAGQTLVFDVRVTDDLGAVAVSADVTATLGSVSFVIDNPIEPVPPFSTVLTVTYVAPTDFVGMDGFILTATNDAGLMALRSVVINIRGEALAPTEPPPTGAAPADEAPLPAIYELILDYNPAATEDQIAAMLASIGAVEVDRLPQIHAMLVKVPEPLKDPQIARAALQSQTQAQAALGTYVEENLQGQIEWVPNDPAYVFGEQWNLYGFAGIYVEDAWNMSTRRGAGVIVAVLDTGVDLQHPDLIGQLVPGWDFVNDDAYPDDDDGHGTIVAGIIAARTNNGIGIAGIAPNAKIMPVRVCGSDEDCTSWFTAAGIIHATDRGARVINISQDWNLPSSTLEGAVNYAFTRNVVVVASVGNDDATTYNYPASYPGVISVAAHNSNGNHPFFSTTNDRIAVSAPATQIFSTIRREDGDYGSASGTSLAAPHVAGIAALLISANVATTPATVREAITCGALDAGSPGYDIEYGWGRVQADWAMNWRDNSSSCKISQPNDDFAAATRITRLPFQVTQPVHTRSVTTQITDPEICGLPPQQTLWYTFKPTKSTYYQFSTIGSSYDTVMEIYQGQQGSLTGMYFGCADDTFSSTQASLAVGLDAGQTYSIAVGAHDGGINDGIMKLDVREAVTILNRNVEENAANLAYSGMWTRTTLRGASGGYVAMTTDNTAAALFTFRGTDLQLARTIGPLQGNFIVELQRVDTGSQWTYPIDNRAAMTTPNQIVQINPSSTTRWYMVLIRRDPAGPLGEVALDRIVALDNSLPGSSTPFSGMVDDRDPRLSYQGGIWYQIASPTSYRGTVTYTSDMDASVNFRVRGSTITVYRSIGPGYGWADVYIDGVYYQYITNSASSGNYYTNVPYAITGLTNMEHTVRLVLTGGTFYFDGAKGSTPPALPPGPLKVDNRDARLTYSGYWESRTGQAGAFNSTTMYSPQSYGYGDQPQVSFQFDGNQFCIGYVKQPGGGMISIDIDGGYYAMPTINTDAGFRSYNEECSDLTNDGRHLVQITHTYGGTDGPVELDYVRALRYNTLTPARGRVSETDPAIMYDTGYGIWESFPSRSDGGYSAQGGAMIYTTTDNARLGFYINGTGFILYTSVGPYQGRWEVWVDGIQQTFESDELGTLPYIRLSDDRWRPVGFGVPDLTPGIHYVELRARINGLWGEVDVPFDGIRVFP